VVTAPLTDDIHGGDDVRPTVLGRLLSRQLISMRADAATRWYIPKTSGLGRAGASNHYNIYNDI